MNTQSQYQTGENRKALHQYSDPLVLNFKVMIEYDGMSGLFGDEIYPNTALAYLKRIGEDERYELLKHLKLLYKNFTKNMDFLVKTVEGLERISNFPPAQMFGYEEDKITIHTDETVDMYVQSMVYLYREICYDMTSRKVRVLPSNLCFFNCNILLFASGYYSDGYDKAEPVDGVEDSDINKLVLPTKKKLYYGESNEFTSKIHETYNHTIFKIEDCQFLVDECGKSFVQEISNEMSDTMVKNNLTFSFQSAHYSGRFNNLVGDRDVTKLLFESALANKQANIEQENKLTVKAIKGDLMKAGKTVAKQSGEKLRATGVTKVNNLFGTNMLFPPTQEFTFERAFQNAGNKLFDKGLQRANSELAVEESRARRMLFNNFSNQLLNGFIVPVATSPTLFPNSPLPQSEPLNPIGLITNLNPVIDNSGTAKLLPNVRKPEVVSANNAKLFF